MLRAALRVLLAPVEVLAAQRNAAPHGEAREVAVLAALRLLVAVFEADLPFVTALRRATLTGGWRAAGKWALYACQQCPCVQSGAGGCWTLLPQVK